MRTLFILGSLLAGSLMAQVQENYTVKMSIKSEGLPAEFAAFGEMDLTTTVKGEKTKTETSSMMFSNIVYFDGNKLTALIESMGNKSGYTATKEEMEGDKNKTPEAKPKIEYIDDTRTIAGYECKKAIVTYIDRDKKERQSTIWFTDKLKPASSTVRKANRRSMAFDLSELNGIPLAMEAMVSMQGMEFKSLMIATEINTNPIDDTVFIPNTDGYNVMSFKEYQEKMKAMGGGGGPR